MAVRRLPRFWRPFGGCSGRSFGGGSERGLGLAPVPRAQITPTQQTAGNLPFEAHAEHKADFTETPQLQDILDLDAWARRHAARCSLEKFRKLKV